MLEAWWVRCLLLRDLRAADSVLDVLTLRVYGEQASVLMVSWSKGKRERLVPSIRL